MSLKDKKLLFLIFVNLAPIGLMFLTSMLTGSKIKTMWMTPFYLFFGVLVIYIFQSQINLNKLKGFTSVFLILFIFSPFAYAYVSITETDKRTDYEGKKIAQEVQKLWDKKYSTKIIYVSGNEWIGGNLSYHLKSRPQWIGVKSKKKYKDRLGWEDLYLEYLGDGTRIEDIKKKYILKNLGGFAIYGK
jgi:hypothetical protein